MSKQRRNVYPGKCTECGETVDAYQGTLSRIDNKWATTHDRCPAAIEAEREAERVAREARHAAALTELAALNLTPVQLVELRVLATAQGGNGYVARKVAIVTRATSLDEALAGIAASCQGMTMDYLYEFSQESTAADLARELATAMFSEVNA